MSRLDLVNYVSHDIHKDESMLSDFTLDEINDENPAEAGSPEETEEGETNAKSTRTVFSQPE